MEKTCQWQTLIMNCVLYMAKTLWVKVLCVNGYVCLKVEEQTFTMRKGVEGQWWTCSENWWKSSWKLAIHNWTFWTIRANFSDYFVWGSHRKVRLPDILCSVGTESAFQEPQNTTNGFCLRLSFTLRCGRGNVSQQNCDWRWDLGVVHKCWDKTTATV